MLDIDALKQRVDKSALPSQQVATSRRGITKVSHAKQCLTAIGCVYLSPFHQVSATPSRARDPYSPLKEGEEAHWEVGVAAC